MHDRKQQLSQLMLGLFLSSASKASLIVSSVSDWTVASNSTLCFFTLLISSCPILRFKSVLLRCSCLYCWCESKQLFLNAGVIWKSVSFAFPSWIALYEPLRYQGLLFHVIIDYFFVHRKSCFCKTLPTWKDKYCLANSPNIFVRITPC